jgi:N-methylhydantoinase A
MRCWSGEAHKWPSSTTAGCEDTIGIGRQARSGLYDWFAPAVESLVPRELRFGVAERVIWEGEILRSPTDAELQALAEVVRASGAEAVAISLLFSFANPETERRVEAAWLSGLPISASHRILPEFREYERASTTVVNAYLAPQDAELPAAPGAASDQEQHAGGRVDVMQSSGGIISARLRPTGAGADCVCRGRRAG